MLTLAATLSPQHSRRNTLAATLSPQHSRRNTLAATLGILFLWFALHPVAFGKQVEIPEHTKKWNAFPDCALIDQKYNDGDSFRVKVNGHEQVLRLCFVDCPEGDSRFADRNKDQAEYFGVPPAEIPEWGKAATAKIGELLAKSFTVHTRWAKAQGSSGLPRFYAVIKCADGKDLGETLVSLGLARVKGLPMKPPTGESVADYQAKLQKLETEARTQRVGIWAKSSKK